MLPHDARKVAGDAPVRTAEGGRVGHGNDSHWPVLQPSPECADTPLLGEGGGGGIQDVLRERPQVVSCSHHQQKAGGQFRQFSGQDVTAAV